ncbi:MAG: SDR family NAD(P)-dependent oxidoreductase [Promethearchaeota archaeon]
MKEFKDKVAVITGAASGIGYGIAEKFAKEGIKVVLADIESKALLEAEQRIRQFNPNVLGILTDVAKIDDVRSLAKTCIDNYGKVDILCNNAGVGFSGNSSTSIWENSLNDWKWIFDVNIWGVINGIHVFLPIMIRQGTECIIINTASMASLITPAIGTSIYSITKFAVIAISESLKHELAFLGSKIKVFALCPGFVQTNLCTSDRNRPKELDNSIKTNPKLEPLINAYRQSIKNGITPKFVADILYQTILNDDKFYIPTDRHRFLRSNVKKRMESIIQDLQKSE